MKESVFVVRPGTLFPVPHVNRLFRVSFLDRRFVIQFFEGTLILALTRFRKFAAAAICADMLGLSGNVHGEMKSHPEIINGRLKDKNQFIQIYHWHF